MEQFRLYYKSTYVKSFVKSPNTEKTTKKADNALSHSCQYLLEKRFALKTKFILQENLTLFNQPHLVLVGLTLKQLHAYTLQKSYLTFSSRLINRSHMLILVAGAIGSLTKQNYRIWQNTRKKKRLLVFRSLCVLVSNTIG